MGYTAKFTRGGRTLTIDDSTYRLGPDFAPPAIRAEHNVGTGTSQNRTGGGEKLGTRYLDRQMVFTVQVRGTSEQAIVQAVRQLVSILEDDSEEPLYFHYKGNTLPEPSWGQFGALKKYPVLSATCGVRQGQYFAGDVRSTQVDVPVTLTVAPFVEGKRVRAAKARGAFYMYGNGAETDMTGGIGASVSSDVNTVLDPAGYNSWTATGGASITKIYDEDYRAYGQPYAVRLKTNGVGTISTVLNATTAYVLSVVYKNSNSGSVLSWTPSISAFTPGTVGTISLGGGFYRYCAYYGSDLTGGTLKFTNSVATAGYNQIVSFYGVGNYNSGHGDLPGWVWSNGTPYASNSACILGSAALPVTGEFTKSGAVALVYRRNWLTDVGNSPYIADNSFAFSLTDEAKGTLYLSHNPTTTATIAFSAAAASEDRRYIVTFNPGTSILYVNGTAAGTCNGSMATAIGKLSFMTQGIAGVARGITLYDKELTAAEVGSVDSALAAAAAASNDAVDFMPYFWAEYSAAETANQNVLLNHLTTGVRNYGALAGIPGDFPPKVELAIAQSSRVADHISVNSSPYFTNCEYFYHQLSGGAMGSASGGSAQTFTDLGTTVTLVGSCNITNPSIIRDYIMGRDWYAIAHMAGTAAGTVSGYVKVNIGGQSYTGGSTTMVHGTTWTIRRANPCNVPRMDYLYDNTFGATYSADLLFYASRTDATANYLVDFVNFVPSPMTYVQGGASDVALILREGEALTGTAAYTAMRYADTFDGRRGLDVKPNQYNNLVLHMGIPGSAYDIARTGTLDFYITPRWGLL